LHNADEYQEATTVLALTQYDMDLRFAPGNARYPPEMHAVQFAPGIYKVE
jgi:hypothetical protein